MAAGRADVVCGTSVDAVATVGCADAACGISADAVAPAGRSGPAAPSGPAADSSVLRSPPVATAAAETPSSADPEEAFGLSTFDFSACAAKRDTDFGANSI